MKGKGTLVPPRGRFIKEPFVLRVLGVGALRQSAAIYVALSGL